MCPTCPPAMLVINLIAKRVQPSFPSSIVKSKCVYSPNLYRWPPLQTVSKEKLPERETSPQNLLLVGLRGVVPPALMLAEKETNHSTLTTVNSEERRRAKNKKYA